ncbi:unnamed protein product [Rotaria socialis]|uniref:Erythromycin esterase n=1 Tax=Rotaria socialis TaxID=392032 RepID=A0A818U5W9_9BILA|nr:unnamed protein product [Rotaria socialis]CAF4608468.1 unnamed protein product [Rotaria socialis]
MADQTQFISIQQNANRLRQNATDDYDSIIVAIGNTHIVIIGEVSHGSHEFYAHQAEITKRLIQEKGCTIIACEADWPSAYRVNRWVKGDSTTLNITDANDALKQFTRFPL